MHSITIGTGLWLHFHALAVLCTVLIKKEALESDDFMVISGYYLPCPEANTAFFLVSRVEEL